MAIDGHKSQREVGSSESQQPRVLGLPEAPPKVLDLEFFTFLLDHEVHNATRLQYCLSVLLLTPDLPSGEPDSGLLTRLAELALRQLRATDLAARFASSSVALLLVDAEPRTLPLIHQRLKEALETDPLVVSGQMSRLTVSAGGGCYPQTATNGRELLEQAAELMIEAKEDGGNRLYLLV